MECDLGWWASKLAETCSVMGLKVFWWARIAKIIGVLGGLIILMDIIGVDNIRSMAEFGSKLLERIGSFIISALDFVKTRFLKAVRTHSRDTGCYTANIGNIAVCFLGGCRMVQSTDVMD